uniref:Reverse transcriptase N-terminal domain-containing protein n=1 Tax=Grateloupia filicina TaxID=31455 RepID=A0A2S1FWZ0_9FLOR|nr:hypothetical protein Grafi_p219 [Grateloupia filicina]AWD77283.1 hypothetical protein Grafi_p219 [Grateloupia filicina]
MKTFQLNCSADWKYLPWNQIKERIFILQAQIYEASKSCNNSLVCKTQNILVNSNEAKLLAIEEVFQSLSSKSLYHNQDYYKLNDKDKYLIFNSLFKQQKLCLNVLVLREKIKQYLMCFCLQPEWEARFEPGLQYSVNMLTSYLFQEKLFRFLNYTLTLSQSWFRISFNCHINNKYMNPKYIIQKFQLSNYLEHCLEFWLNSNYIQFDQDFILSFKIHSLCQLLYRIMLNGVEWFYSMVNELYYKGRQYNIYQNLSVYCEINMSYWIFMDHTFMNTLIFILKFFGFNINKLNTYYIQYTYKNYYVDLSHVYSGILDRITSSNLTAPPIIKIVNNICKPLLLNIKSILYNKDLINRLRANKNIDIFKAISTVNKLTLKFYNYYALFLPLRIIKYIYKNIDFIIYSWIKKRNENKDLSKLISHKSKRYFMKSLLNSKFYIVNQICIEKLSRK